MKRNSGFTLVELVVVVLILGILAAIAAPKIMNNSDKAIESSAASTLASLRDAVELYRADPANNGALPTSTSEAALKTAMDPYIRGTAFPKSPVGAKTNTVRIVNGVVTATTGGAWGYNSVTGDFTIDCTATMPSGGTYSEL